MREMVTEHDRDVALFQRQASATKDGDLKAWIEKTLPILRQHVQMAQTTARNVGAATASGSAAGQTGEPKKARSQANR
jgi:hypothetical protein